MNAFDKIIGYESIKAELIQFCDMIKNKSNGDIFAILNFDYVEPFNDLMKED